jgi:hypothetical protein
MNSTIARLIASGKAISGKYTGTGGVTILDAPPGKGLIVYRIEVEPFSDIPVGNLFTQAAPVAFFSWHQLNVWNQQGQQVWQFRDTLNTVLVGAVNVALPSGNCHQFDCWINGANYVTFQLTHAPQPFPAWGFALGAVPGGNREMPPVPFGYGNEPAPPSLFTPVRVLFPGGASESRPLGQITVPAFSQSFLGLQWPIDAATQLNPPQPGIPFGQYTMPIINIYYLIVEGNPTEVMKGAL